MKKYLLLILLFCISFEMKAQSLTNRQVYDFSVGDVIQTHAHSNITQSPEHWEDDYDSIISKSISANNDTFYYTSFHFHVGLTTSFPPGTSPYHNTKGIQSWYVCNLDSLPIDTFHNFQPNIDSIIIDTNNCNHSVWWILDSATSVYTHENRFISGLGGPYYFNSEEVWHGYETRDLTFYKTQCITSGTRFNFSAYYYNGIEASQKENKLSLFPNPTTSTFTISKNTNEALQFHLYNLIGQQVLINNLKESETIIERNNLATGTYLFSITNASGRIIENGKLIFE
ncbi:MAG: Secretion system C-terminal sorting domain [Bacteroidota bacterium]